MSMKLKGLQGGGANSEINITPLIDVVLVLLIIFMVLTPIIIEEMAVNLPDKTEEVQQQDMPQEQLLAATCADGTYTLNKKVVTQDELRSQVEKRLRSKSPKVVFVDGHPDAPYDRMVVMMDTIRDAGAERLGIAELKTVDDFRACDPIASSTPGAAPAPGGAAPPTGP